MISGYMFASTFSQPVASWTMCSIADFLKSLHGSDTNGKEDSSKVTLNLALAVPEKITKSFILFVGLTAVLLVRRPDFQKQC